jgi:acyl-CoA thioester hydrolase
MPPPLQASIQLKVRDYECDMQGIVNNAVYQNYLEHARHEYLLGRGLDFAEITRAGVHLVVIRAEIDYKRPLKSGDGFKVVSQLERVSRLKFKFRQQIVSLDEKQTYINACIFCASLNDKGRPASYEGIESLF